MTGIKYKNPQLQSIVGNILRYGVWIALTVTVIGGLVYLGEHHSEIPNYSIYVENKTNILLIIKNIYIGIGQGLGESIIFLGVFILLLTPVLRLLLSLISFLIERDYLYSIITIMVIFIIVLSIYFGYSH